MNHTAAEHHETIRTLTPGREVALEKLSDKRGSLTATATPLGVVFRWRYTEGGRQHRWVIGSFDRKAPHNAVVATPAGYSVLAAYREAERLGSAHRAGLKTDTQQGHKATQQKRAAEREAQRQQREAAERAATVTARQAWDAYILARQGGPRWGEHTQRDHEKLAQVGGRVSTRGTRGRGVTVDGPLVPLLALHLVDVTEDAIDAWAKVEGAHRPTTARKALRCFRRFLNWCAKDPQFKALVHGANPAKSAAAWSSLGTAKAKDDVLLREQLPVWFDAVGKLQNPTVSAYLRVLLLTGARPGEVLGIRWEDLNTRWRSLSIRDKVEGNREIPLTPYVANLIQGLPRRNGYVFASTRRVDGEYRGTVTTPGHYLDKVCAVAGLEKLTLHGLRRSFASLTEWLEVPTGVVAQIMGHKPSATAEKHYKRRPLDLLRTHHERIEAWILEQAGVGFQSTGGAVPANVVGLKRA